LKILHPLNCDLAINFFTFYDLQLIYERSQALDSFKIAKMTLRDHPKSSMTT